jgi:hypothetical protein
MGGMLTVRPSNSTQSRARAPQARRVGLLRRFAHTWPTPRRSLGVSGARARTALGVIAVSGVVLAPGLASAQPGVDYLNNFDYSKKFSRPLYFVWIDRIDDSAMNEPVLWPSKPDSNNGLPSYYSGHAVHVSFAAGPYSSPLDVCKAHIERMAGVPEEMPDDRTFAYTAPTEPGPAGTQLSFACSAYDNSPQAGSGGGGRAGGGIPRWVWPLVVVVGLVPLGWGVIRWLNTRSARTAA